MRTIATSEVLNEDVDGNATLAWHRKMHRVNVAHSHLAK